MKIRSSVITSNSNLRKAFQPHLSHTIVAYLLLLTLTVPLLCLPQAAVAQQADADDWQFTLTPYLWIPTIAGDVKFEPPSGGGSPTFDLGPTDWFDMLNFAAFLGGSAKKGRFSILSDMAYLSMTNEPDSRLASVDALIPGPGLIEIPVGIDVTLDTETDLTGFMWSGAIGYELLRTDTSYLDAFIGARYFGVDVETSWSLSAAITTPGGTEVFPAEGRIDGSTDLWDAIIGVRGQFALGQSRWSVPYYADVGSGSSDLTWNVFAGLSYGFEWGDLLFAYRHLEYDEGDTGLLQGFSFTGPAIGATFRF